MNTPLNTRDEIADRHRRLFELLRTGEIRANIIDSDFLDPNQRSASDLRADDASALTDLLRKATESLKFKPR